MALDEQLQQDAERVAGLLPKAFESENPIRQWDFFRYLGDNLREEVHEDRVMRAVNYLKEQGVLKYEENMNISYHPDSTDS